MDKPVAFYIVFMALFPVGIAVLNWLVSLFQAPDNSDVSVSDLKDLAADSTKFFKNQWPFILFCAAGSAFSYTSPLGTQQPSALGASGNTLMMSIFAALPIIDLGLVPVIKLFYLSYLGQPKNPALISSLGIWTVIVYVMAETIVMTISGIGLFMLLAPGLIIVVRTALMLPAYALEGHHPMEAIRRSWSLTEGHYWMVSRYLGPLMIATLLTSAIPTVFLTIQPDASKQSLIFQVFASLIGSVTIVLSLLMTGLMYKLYERLSDPNANSPWQPTTPES